MADRLEVITAYLAIDDIPEQKRSPVSILQVPSYLVKSIISISLPGDSGYMNMSEATNQNSKVRPSINYLHHIDAVPAENLRI